MRYKVIQSNKIWVVQDTESYRIVSLHKDEKTASDTATYLNNKK